jgi:hypothetical protein
VKVIGQYHDGVDREWVTLVRLTKRCPQYIEMIRQQRQPSLRQIHGEEEASARNEDVITGEGDGFRKGSTHHTSLNALEACGFGHAGVIEDVAALRIATPPPLRHCERSEAIQRCVRRNSLDCFVARAPRNDGVVESPAHALAARTACTHDPSGKHPVNPRIQKYIAFPNF